MVANSQFQVDYSLEVRRHRTAAHHDTPGSDATLCGAAVLLHKTVVGNRQELVNSNLRGLAKAEWPTGQQTKAQLVVAPSQPMPRANLE